jgi:hypothetical protein
MIRKTFTTIISVSMALMVGSCSNQNPIAIDNSTIHSVASMDPSGPMGVDMYCSQQDYNGRPFIFAVGNSNRYLYSRKQNQDGSWPSAWTQLGTQKVNVLASAINQNNTVIVFSDNSFNLQKNVKYIQQSYPGGSFSSWTTLPSDGTNYYPTNFEIGMNANGKLILFVLKYLNLVALTQDSPGGRWSNTWENLNDGIVPDNYGGLCVERNADGRLEVFTTISHDVLHKWQTTPNGPWSNGWESLDLHMPYASTYLAVGRNQDGRLEVFAVRPWFAEEPTTTIYHCWQTAPNSGWSGWYPLLTVQGQISGFMTVASNSDGRLELFFAMGNNHNMIPAHIWQVAPNGGWSSYNTMTNQITEKIAIGKNIGGYLTAFINSVVVSENHIFYSHQSEGWNPWTSLSNN